MGALMEDRSVWRLGGSGYTRFISWGDALAFSLRASASAGPDTQLGEPNDAHDRDHACAGDGCDEQCRAQRYGAAEAEVLHLDDSLVLQDQDDEEYQQYKSGRSGEPCGGGFRIASSTR